MKKTLLLCAAVGATLASLTISTAMADEAMAKAKNCLACHTVDKKLVGPAYKDIAERFASEPDAVVILAEKIQNGSQGDWGAIPMPPNKNVNEAEATQLAEWIMTLN